MENNEEKVEQETTNEVVQQEVTTENTEAPVEQVQPETPTESVEQNISTEVPSEPKKEKKKSKKGLIILLVVLILLLSGAGVYFFVFRDKTTKTNKVTTDKKDVYSEYRMSGNSLEKFDLAFLKLENEEKNKVYSPLSIKYALEMLSEGANGETKKQLDAIIGDYKAKKYTNNEHMSFANAVFIKEAYKNSVKSNYTNTLSTKYNAEVLYDTFATPDNVNSWVSNKTFNLVNNLFSDVSDKTFLVINALAIDMQWTNKIQCEFDESNLECKHYHVNYTNEKYSDSVPVIDGGIYETIKFDDNQEVKSLQIAASINNYDAVKDIGEENIRKIVGEEYKKWLESTEGKWDVEHNHAETDVNKFLDGYIEGLNSNYKQSASSTDFKLYDDDEVKVFSKELQEYNGTTLEYISIMPKKVKLNEYINNIDAEGISNIIKNLKDIKNENFKEGVITKVTGYIPVFKMDYELKLEDDLKSLGVKNIFDVKKSDLTGIMDGPNKIEATHKANIEFSNQGIKAAAVTVMGGLGSTTGGFHYDFDVPVEEIDITFDKPYMYIIRDKNSGEVWFTGTVYEPIQKQ